MLTQDQIQALKTSRPPEALSTGTSRGFELTSIKAAQAPAVIKRLNEVFGPCSIDWRYVHSPFEELHTGNKQVEIVTEVAFQYRFLRHQRLHWLGPGGAAPRLASTALSATRRPCRRRQVGGDRPG